MTFDHRCQSVPSNDSLTAPPPDILVTFPTTLAPVIFSFEAVSETSVMTVSLLPRLIGSFVTSSDSARSFGMLLLLLLYNALSGIEGVALVAPVVIF